MSNATAEMLRVSRQLTPEHQTDLLAWVRLAYAAERSAQKPPCGLTRRAAVNHAESMVKETGSR